MSWYKFFIGGCAFSALAIVIAAWIGGVAGVITVSFLIVLETSLSFDNAVVNAGILAHWDPRWRRRFLTWGMVVAVFGMRLIFPLLIVAVAGGVGPVKALDLAVNEPVRYGQMLAAAHHQIAAFGGAFLLMVFFNFFVAEHKKDHWFALAEKPLTRLGRLEAVEATLTLLVILLCSYVIDEPARRGEFVGAGVWGVIVFVASHGLTALLGDADSADKHSKIVRQGWAGFCYLEVLDASFSFDGVVGAFALTSNLIIITLGLGAGAMFVRDFTLFLVARGTLTHYRYLEHGAFWAVGALAVVMLAGVEFHIPEAVTGLIGGLLIGAALASSRRRNSTN